VAKTLNASKPRHPTPRLPMRRPYGRPFAEVAGIALMPHHYGMQIRVFANHQYSVQLWTAREAALRLRREPNADIDMVPRTVTSELPSR
jgi:hypothetical protein